MGVDGREPALLVMVLHGAGGHERRAEEAHTVSRMGAVLGHRTILLATTKSLISWPQIE